MSASAGLLAVVVALSSFTTACRVNSTNCDFSQNVGQLVCRDSDRLVIRTAELGMSEEKIHRAVQCMEYPRVPEAKWIPYLETNESVLLMKVLTSNTSYLFRMKAFNEDDWTEYGPYTTQTDELELEPLRNLSVSDFIYKGGKVAALLTWKPGSDMSCHTQLLIHEENSIGQMNPTEIEVEKLYHYPLLLDFSKVYTITMFTQKLTEDFFAESESDHAILTFTTPSCLNITNYDINLCRPEKPQNIKFSILPECNLKINWDKPLKFPFEYNINLYQVGSDPTFQHVAYEIIPGDQETYTAALSLNSSIIIIQISAVGPAGTSEMSEKRVNYSCVPPMLKTAEIKPHETAMLWIGGSVGVISCTIFVVSMLILVSKRQAKKAEMIDTKDSKTFEAKGKTNKQEQVEAEIIPQDEIYENSNDKDDRWSELKGLELMAENVVLCQQLGKGEFGVVYRALLTNRTPPSDIAVKSLREGSTAEDFMKLESEAVVMAAVGRHKHIVSLLGYYKRGNHVSLVVEYCSRGDLLNYLRSIPRPESWRDWKRNSDPHLLAVSNALYDTNGIVNPQNFSNSHFKLTDLLSFARQIALGMEYLSHNHVVHRDLAARNVLICEDLTAKICDFGLSRDVYETSIYQRRGSDRLPLKWMALESLAYQIFTTKSDVWSYGVLLWEMATLGESPYPSIATSELLNLLKQGYRMERPPHTSHQLYKLMLSCWEGDPHQRPCFSKLVQKVDEVISSESNNMYLQLSSSDHQNSLPNFPEEYETT